MSRGSIAAIAVMVLGVLAGCPDAGNDLLGRRTPSWLDGSWWVEISNAPNGTLLTFTDGKVTSELGGGFEPVEITWSSTATIDGNTVRFSYGSQQTIVLTTGVINWSGTAELTGTIQDDGSIAGTMVTSGTVNGVPGGDTDAFIMRRR